MRAISASSFWIDAFVASIFDAESISAIASSILPSACATRASSTCNAARSGERRRPKSAISSLSSARASTSLPATRWPVASAVRRSLSVGSSASAVSSAGIASGRRAELRQIDRDGLARELASELLVFLEQRQRARQVTRERLPQLGLAIEIREQLAQLDRGRLVVDVGLDRGDRAVGLIRRQMRLRELLDDDHALAGGHRAEQRSRATARPAPTGRARGSSARVRAANPSVGASATTRR